MNTTQKAANGKYRNQTYLTVVEAIKPKPSITLSKLWEMYVVYKAPTVAVSTLKNAYSAISYHVNKLPKQSLEDALEIRDYLVDNLKPDTAKKYLNNITACCDWGVNYGHISNNPFLGMTKDIKTQPKQLEDIKPFSKAEKDAIIKAFETDLYYSHYASFVKFLFFTGCRTSEAIGLKWKHINPDCQKINFCESYVRGTRKGTKTGKPRIFPCNAQLQNFLKSIKPESGDPESLVFPSPEGKEIDDHNFLSRAWKGYKNRHGNKVDGVVTRLVKEGLVSEYRSQYNTRHTFITQCLEAGINVVQIAKWVGNTPEIIMRHYAGITAYIQVPFL